MKQRAHAVKGRSIHNDSASELDWPEPGSSRLAHVHPHDCTAAKLLAELTLTSLESLTIPEGHQVLPGRMPGLSSAVGCSQFGEILLYIPRHPQMEKLEWVMAFTHASIVVFRGLHDWLEVVAFINLPSSWAEPWSGAASPACLQHCPGLWQPGGCSCPPTSDANRGSAIPSHHMGTKTRGPLRDLLFLMTTTITTTIIKF